MNERLLLWKSGQVSWVEVWEGQDRLTWDPVNPTDFGIAYPVTWHLKGNVYEVFVEYVGEGKPDPVTKYGHIVDTALAMRIAPSCDQCSSGDCLVCLNNAIYEGGGVCDLSE